MPKIIQIAVTLLVAFVAAQFLPLDWWGPVDPKPQPKPGPVDPADPKPEPTFAGYDVKVYERVVKVKSRSRATECEQLASDIQSIIDRIDAGTITTNQGVVDALATSLRKLPSSWYGQIRKIADEVLQPLTKDGSLSTPQRWEKLLTVVKPGVVRAGKDSTGVAEEIDGG